MAVLIIKRSKIPILTYPLNGHSICIGRNDTSDIHLLGECVSRDHGIIASVDDGYSYTNLGRNGTLLNGQAVDDHVLKPGDTLTIADWQLQFLTDNRTRHTETVLSAASRMAQDPAHLAFVGDSPAIRAVKNQVTRLAQCDAPVCILGDTGSGKEVVALSIHSLSSRASGPFVAVNCGAIPESMIESELFGYVKGAFTGAVRNHQGYFAQANGGTLFLDELGELPLDLQTRFLRVLETGTFRQLGATSTTTADFRIICATHRNLQQAVRDGSFREDLFFRLYVLPVTVPSLRGHIKDIPALVEHFTALFGRSDITWSDDALRKLTSHSWPGNVRELKNTVQRSLIMSASSTITAHDVYLLHSGVDRSSKNLEDQERINIISALTNSGGNNTRAAEELGISRTTLIAKIRRLNISLQEI